MLMVFTANVYIVSGLLSVLSNSLSPLTNYPMGTEGRFKLNPKVMGLEPRQCGLSLHIYSLGLCDFLVTHTHAHTGWVSSSDSPGNLLGTGVVLSVRTQPVTQLPSWEPGGSYAFWGSVGPSHLPKWVPWPPSCPEENHAVDMPGAWGWGPETGGLGVVEGHKRNKPGLHVASYGPITWCSHPL